VESIRELKTICQTTAKKDVTNVYMRYVCRSVSIHITRLLIPTNVTADQVSFVMILTGVIANLFFLSPYRIVFLLGTLVLQFWYILDCVDGEIARYRAYQKNQQVVQEKMELQMTGAYWDYLNHYIVHGLVPLTTSFGLYQATKNTGWILIGFVASISQTLLLAVHDAKSRAFVAKIRKMIKSNWVGSRDQETSPQSNKSQWNFAKWAFVIIHYSCTYPTVMNVATLVAILSVMRVGGPDSDFRPLFLLYYSLASLTVFLGIATKNLRNHGLDYEFDEHFFAEPRG